MHTHRIKTTIKSLTINAVLLLTSAMLLTNTSAAQINPSIQFDNNVASDSTGTLNWEKIYGGSGDDRALYTLPLESGFLVVGSTKSHSDATEGWALLLNSSGNMVWNRTYREGTGTELRYAISLPDGFLLIGNQLLAGDVNGYIAKTDRDGKIVWTTIVGGENIDKLFAGVADSNGDVTVFGLTFPDGNSAKSAGWAVKLDADGGVVWQKIYGQSQDTALRSAINTGDGYVAAGYTDPTGQGNYDFYLLKISSDGTQIWNQTYGGTDSEKAYSMAIIQDGYVLAGESHNVQTDGDALVVKVDFDGKLLWSKSVGGAGADSASSIIPARDGGFLVCGFTFSFGAGQRDFWLFKISSEGQVLFSCALGDSAFQEAYGVVDLGGDRYFLAGWTDPAGQPELVGKATYDFWIVEINVTQQPSLSTMHLIVAFAVGIAAVLVALFVLFRKRKTKN
ncbi:MAG: hypothetical protein NWE96_03250 [Candidatus Bathyarchaeota archaeon]|nr:hypothetical protein [Candidatus Bathyarchaeota archaeon]